MLARAHGGSERARLSESLSLQGLLARGITLVVAVALLAIGVRLFLQALAFTDGDLLGFWGLRVTLDPFTLPAVSRVTWAGMGLAMSLSSLALLWVALGGLRPRGRWFVLARRGRSGGQGASDVSLSAAAAEKLVAEAAHRVEGVWEAQPTLHLKRGGWKVLLQLYLRREAEVPEVAAEVEEAVAVALREHTGIDLDGMKIRAQLGPYERAWRR